MNLFEKLSSKLKKWGIMQIDIELLSSKLKKWGIMQIDVEFNIIIIMQSDLS